MQISQLFIVINDFSQGHFSTRHYKICSPCPTATITQFANNVTGISNENHHLLLVLLLYLKKFKLKIGHVIQQWTITNATHF